MMRLGTAALLSLLALQAGAARAGVDLRVVSVLQTAPLPGPIIHQTIPVIVTLRNAGDQPTGPFSVSLWRNQSAAPTDPATADQSQPVTSLPAHDASIEVTFQVTYDSPGTYDLWIWADSGSQLADRYTADNKYSILLTVTQDLPDLLVENIVPDTAAPLAGQPFKVVVSIRNQGNVAAGPSHLALWKDRLAPPADATDADTVVSVDPIPAHELSLTTLSVTYDTAGTYRLWLLADADHQLQQINQNNDAVYIEVVATASTQGVLRLPCGADGTQNLPLLGALAIATLLCIRHFASTRNG